MFHVTEVHVTGVQLTHRFCALVRPAVHSEASGSLQAQRGLPHHARSGHALANLPAPGDGTRPSPYPFPRIKPRHGRLRESAVCTCRLCIYEWWGSMTRC